MLCFVRVKLQGQWFPIRLFSGSFYYVFDGVPDTRTILTPIRRIAVCRVVGETGKISESRLGNRLLRVCQLPESDFLLQIQAARMQLLEGTKHLVFQEGFGGDLDILIIP